MKISNIDKVFDKVDNMADKDSVVNTEENPSSDMSSFLDKVVEHGKTYTSDGSVGQTMVKTKSKRPLLLVSAMYAEEIRYIKSLEKDYNIADVDEATVIDVCYLIEQGAKPICKLPLTFDVVMAIKSYRDMPLYISFNGRHELTVESILNLP